MPLTSGHPHSPNLVFPQVSFALGCDFLGFVFSLVLIYSFPLLFGGRPGPECKLYKGFVSVVTAYLFGTPLGFEKVVSLTPLPL